MNASVMNFLFFLKNYLFAIFFILFSIESLVINRVILKYLDHLGLL